ncbi:MAG: peptidoglycan DD-metalloendopeptidase family protein [Ectothiorhodospiraceae bacterium]|nr:peptidoglycan DD-metalloendopeptidase family protein [Ectothiorhodospiraceae bacterium]MCH8505905.1 peptidoglycan DD-metalloendopeptidase family protein [Ectothiorhodospiraceae bacterium]
MESRNSPLLIALLLMVLLLAGCAGDTYAPVSDRGGRAGGQASGGTYEVVRGDTLYSIAFRFGIDHRDLANWNSITSPFIIYPGQTLRLSQPAGGAVARAPSGSRPSQPSSQQQSSRSSASAPRQAPSPPRSSSNASSSPPSSWAWPVEGEVIKKFTRDDDGKQGINIAGREGESVKAAAAGRVVYSGSGLVGYGNLIIIKHDGDYLTAYGYNSQLLVREGEDVQRGQSIARMGNSGGRPMLHFELRRDGSPVDPLQYLP